ncbi:4-hydroxy-tetrahydrodipicolinate synthase [Cytophagaceae bacterium ABcell3]|nr:4-hydroxy-tetrahydrodipicolinate synthase [Cytophagaceae bacterium ABcell3]
MGIDITGTGVALATPFKADLTPDLAAFGRLLDHVLKGGVDYVVVNGTTAESATTNSQEKTLLLDTAKKHLQGKLPIVYGIGGNNTADTISRIKSTDLEGVKAVLSVCPYYNKPSQEGIYQHYIAIADNCPVPIILYNVPGRTGVNITAQTTIRLSQHPNIIGVKDAGGDLTQGLEVVKGAAQDFYLISGDDMLTVPMISIGAKGVISVLANAYPSQYSEMVRKSLDQNFQDALPILKSFSGLNPLLYEESNPVGIKQALELLNICEGHVRLPLVKCSDSLKDRIREKMTEVN